MNKHVLNVFFRYYIEWTFASLILLLLHLLSSKPMPLLFSMVISATASLSFTVLLEKKGNLAKPLYFLLIMPSIFLAGFMGGLATFYISLLALFVFWRTLRHFQDATARSESIWLVLTFFIGLFMTPLASFHESVYLKQMTFILLFQLLFTFLGQFVLKWIDVEFLLKRKFAFDFSKLLGAGLLLVMAISIGRNIIKETFFFILQGVGWVLSMIFYPFFAWIDHPLVKERASRLFSQKQEEAEYKSQFDISKQLIDPDLWGPILFGSIGAIIFFYLYKRTSLLKKDQEIEVTPNGFIISNLISDKMSGDAYFKRNSAIPANYLRKEIYQLEKFARKKDLGRLSHEAINEWLNRLCIDYDERIVDEYQNIRYGGIEKENSEDWVTKEIRSIKKQFSNLHKERKEASKPGLKDSIKSVFRR
jgi:hypothetical protein